MTPETIFSIFAVLVAISSAVWTGRDTQARISKTKTDIEKTLREMLDAETLNNKKLREDLEEKGRQLDRAGIRLERAGQMIEELLWGAEVLIHQIETEFQGVPRWTPKRRKEDYLISKEEPVEPKDACDP